MNFNPAHIKVIAFDVFGTVVDWHGSICAELQRMAVDTDADRFVLAWRAGYAPAMKAVMDNHEWVILDQLHRQILDAVLVQFGLESMPEAEREQLNSIWHRLDPWPDSVEGLNRLKTRFKICSLSNGNIDLLSDMAQHGSLPWDRILSAETFHKYKPDPATYLGVAEQFQVLPGETMLAAAHHRDLAAARDCGLGTAYIERPLEFGTNNVKDVSAKPANNIHAGSIIDLAEILGC
ncbi:MAG: 2-haloacid dehalogenase [Planctomycetota bacterium]|jgi:2-haloacid dehalogenase